MLGESMNMFFGVVFSMAGAFSAPRCQSPIDILSSVGVAIEPLEKSRVEIDHLSTEFQIGQNFTFDFKTTSQDGLLFYASRRNDVHFMAAVELRGGSIQYTIMCPWNDASLTIAKVRVDDGNWHTLGFRRGRFSGIITLDGVDFFGNYVLDCEGFTSVMFGGINPLHDGTPINRILQNKFGHFKGCIRNLRVSTGLEAPPYYVAVSECS
ncbi:hypothetical protein ScPMuIL_000588 [Solemya velum]